MATLAAGWTRAVLRYATVQGMNKDRLLEAAGLEEAQLASPDLRVRREQDLRLWASVESGLKDDAMGLRLGQAATTCCLGLVGFAMRSCSTLGEGLELFMELHPLIRDWGRAELLVSPSSVTLRAIAAASDGRWTRSMAEAVLSTEVVLSDEWLGRKTPVKEVHFQHERPRELHLYEQIFGCPVYFGQEYNELVLHREAMEVPLLRPEPGLREYLVELGRVRLGSLSQARAVAEVQATLDECLRQEHIAPKVEQVARRLCTSVRSLQRSLQQQNLTYQELVDQARHRWAMELLQSPGMTMGQVSSELGFSDPRAFRRALKRWMQKPRNAAGENKS
ncbi:MAG TPA: AraC family transcriptional regulator [Myxococcaceae bacterium]|nr:AraC family transcriptional regulator [Myxococcaceae bacterium]